MVRAVDGDLLRALTYIVPKDFTMTLCTAFSQSFAALSTSYILSANVLLEMAEMSLQPNDVAGDGCIPDMMMMRCYPKAE